MAGIADFEMFTILLSRLGWLQTDSAEVDLFLKLTDMPGDGVKQVDSMIFAESLGKRMK